jgi:hypothetical protein
VFDADELVICQFGIRQEVLESDVAGVLPAAGLTEADAVDAQELLEDFICWLFLSFVQSTEASCGDDLFDLEGEAGTNVWQGQSLFCGLHLDCLIAKCGDGFSICDRTPGVVHARVVIAHLLQYGDSRRIRVAL